MHAVIAISNKVGHSDTPLTVTCSHSWPEIPRFLLSDQVPSDRPDLRARVFCIKLRAFMSSVIQEQLFGTVAAFDRVAELQKCGLPHAHCILFLDEASKHELRSRDNEDRVISTEIPPESDGHL